MEIMFPMKPIFPLQSVGKYTVSKKESLQSPLSVNVVDLLTLHDTQASYTSVRSLKAFLSGRNPT